MRIRKGNATMNKKSKVCLSFDSYKNVKTYSRLPSASTWLTTSIRKGNGAKHCSYKTSNKRGCGFFSTKQ